MLTAPAPASSWRNGRQAFVSMRRCPLSITRGLDVNSDVIVTKRTRHPIWILYEVWVMVVGLGVFALICLGSIPVFSVLYLVLPKAHHRRTARQMISCAFRAYLFMLRWVCCIRCDARALDALRKDGPLIVVANHPSLLDAVVLLSRLPNGTCIMKAALQNNPLYGIATRMAGYVSNANAERMLNGSRTELAQGSHFIIFPEGGRSRQFPVSPFSSSCILLSRLTGAPIQTVLLDYSSPYLGKHWGLFCRPALPLNVEARMGRRIAPTELRPESRDVLENYFRSEVRFGQTVGPSLGQRAGQRCGQP
jgi:1-acyl-sn-glycerol-3-phosphate acyltransferase